MKIGDLMIYKYYDTKVTKIQISQLTELQEISMHTKSQIPNNKNYFYK